MKQTAKKVVKELKSKKPLVPVISEGEKLKLIANLIIDQLVTKYREK